MGNYVKLRNCFIRGTITGTHHPYAEFSKITKLHPNLRYRSNMVGLGRLELPTPRLSSVCSNQLSYKPTPAVTSL